MQIVATVALVAAAALELTSAAPEGHLRLHLESANTNAKVAEWQQCKWNDHTVACDSGLICAVQNDYYGQCVKKQAGLWGQCAGKNWTGSCVSGAKCEKKDDWYSQCVPDKSSSSGGIAEWQQCHWETYELACASGLQCAVENKWWGMCVKKQADLWGQCGGKNWSATCKSGKCVKKDDYYSQCQQ